MVEKVDSVYKEKESWKQLKHKVFRESFVEID